MSLLIAGAGGHALVMLEAAKQCGYDIAGLWAEQYGNNYCTPLAHFVLERNLAVWQRQGVYTAAIGIGSVDTGHSMDSRILTYLKLKECRFQLPSIIHPKAIVERYLFDIGDAIAIMSGAIVQAYVQLGRNVLINSGAIVEHGCIIHDHVHIASGAVLAGDVTVGAESHIGAGAVIRQGITIGERVCVGAGAVVVKDVPDGMTVVGNPAAERATLSAPLR